MLKHIHSADLLVGAEGDNIYEIAKAIGGLCIDGGAAAGYVTKRLVESSSVKVIAFEPFIGNFSYFEKNAAQLERVSFHKKALGRQTAISNFYVSRVIDGNQKGWEHLLGYSSEGYLTDGKQKGAGQNLSVEVVKLEDYIEEKVTLLKMDLQGGEYDALLGLGCKAPLVDAIYTEFSLEWQTLDWLLDNNFVVFDTELTGIPKVPMEKITHLYQSFKVLNLSNGSQAVTGYVKGLPRDAVSYREYLESFKEKYFHHLWTDLIAVSPSMLGKYILAGETLGK